MRRLLFFVCSVVFAGGAECSTLLVLQFHNNSQYSDLNWVGESIAETLISELSAANQIALDRDARAEGLRKLSLRPDAGYTKATIIRLGQSLDVDTVCYGSYEINLPSANAELKDSSVRITAQFLDLRKMRDGPEISEAGNLSDLTRLEEHLAWQTLKYVDPTANLPLDQFMAPAKLIRLDAEESYIRGLMSTNPEQQEKWFLQANKLDPQFAGPAFELGRLELKQKNYRQAITWLQRVPTADVRYGIARFKMGLAAFHAGDFGAANSYFHEVSNQFPLSEVYNNIGAAENELNQPAAIDEFRRALEGDQNDATYLFNLSLALLKNNQYDEATKRLRLLVTQYPDDAEARNLYNHATGGENVFSGSKPPQERLKDTFNETAYRQLKAALTHSGN
ncbi:MAG TPA: tetratricopeptide repeat protein [Bryobacteraceae bacterium]|nr:tetratricopeptide repeat protein [Bryobacteraceae bacterium]